MSRVCDDYDYDGESFNNEWAFWQHRTRQVMNSKRGKKALAELREALLALPEKRLISGALSTAGKRADDSGHYDPDRDELLEQGEGVCAVGAFIWYQKVKGGADPEQAMRDLPLLPDYDGDPTATADQGAKAGLAWTLAWVLMSRNDSNYEDLTPEARYEAYLAWLNDQLAPVDA